MVEEPGQNESVPEITGVAGSEKMLVVTEALFAEQFDAFLTVTEKFPAVFTEMVCVVCPFDQR